MMELIKEFEHIMKHAFETKPDVEAKATTVRVKEIGAEMKAFKEKYPKCKIH